CRSARQSSFDAATAGREPAARCRRPGVDGHRRGRGLLVAPGVGRRLNRVSQRSAAKIFVSSQKGGTMIPRLSFATFAALAVLAGPVLGQTATPTEAQGKSSVAATPGGQGFTVPPYSCVQPKYPSKEGVTQLRAEAYNKAVEQFNKDYKVYAE